LEEPYAKVAALSLIGALTADDLTYVALTWILTAA